ncbi:hypothetical protein [Bacillus sp. Brlt_9]|uniref:hypothetical protein n=1 Tax=Bacillus sp. Brlt_9 TaxID=3110916 RepID=UPI003F7B79B7
MKRKKLILLAGVCFLIGVLGVNLDFVQKYTFAGNKYKVINTNEKVGTGITVMPNK